MEIGIVGASGYAGSELVRLLLDHLVKPSLRCFSSSQVGEPVEQSLMGLAGFEGRFEAWGPALLEGMDFLFSSLPGGEAVAMLQAAREAGVPAIDVGSDLRLPAEEYPRWYGYEHPAPELLDETVYGIPEVRSE